MIRKKFQELLLKDNFLFGAVMTDEEICRELLEIVLGIRISHVTVSREHSIVYHPEYKGVRLDAYAKDEESTRYNVEMQVAPNDDLRKRSRYYHSQIDMDLLLSGRPYKELPKCFVIFICDFDPFGKNLYRYAFQNRCREDEELLLEDGSVSVFLSTKGTNRSEVSPELIHFLEFVRADLTESRKESEDEFVRKLQASIRRVKESREMERLYMRFEELLQDERAAGRAEGLEQGLAEGLAEGLARGKAESVLEHLQRLGEVPRELEKRILSEKDPELLSCWNKLTDRAESIEAFIAGMDA